MKNLTCPMCGNNAIQGKGRIKIFNRSPQKGVKSPDKKGRWSVMIICGKCGHKLGPIYQKKIGDRVEKFSELKERTIKLWNTKKGV